MAFIDSSAVNVALPSIQVDLRSDAAKLAWVVEGYALFMSALILVGGALGDRLGRRRTFVAGIALFALASAACAAAQTIEQLDVARCLQGAGGALATPGSLALISANFAGPARGRAIGTWSGFAAITAAIGPLLGGWLAQSASWRYVFLINLPPALFVIVAASLAVPESRDREASPSVDVAGAILVTLGLGGLTFGLTGFGDGTRDGVAALSTALGSLLLVAFVGWEKRARSPMVPLHVFRNAAFTGANLYTLLLYAALGGSFYFVPFDLQNVQRYSPTAAGAAMLPFILIMFAFARPSGGLAAAVGARLPLVTGAIVAGFGFLCYARIGVGGSYWTTFFPAAVVLGAGGALFVAPLTTAVMSALDTAQAGVASGINNAVARVAGLLAIAVLGIVLSTTFYSQFDRTVSKLPLSAATRQTLERDRAALSTGRPVSNVGERDRTLVDGALASAYTAGFRWNMVVCALAAWLAALVAWRTIPAGPLRASRET